MTKRQARKLVRIAIQLALLRDDLQRSSDKAFPALRYCTMRMFPSYKMARKIIERKGQP
jgi:hypothetical protein